MSNHGTVDILAPLFHRLVDEEPLISEEAIPLRSLSLPELKRSIRSEISWILNTRYSRLPFSVHAFNENQTTDGDRIAYGLVDFSHFDVSQLSEKRRLERHVQTALEYYEPRLINIKVSVESVCHRTSSARLIISGDIKAFPIPERYTFAVDVRHKI